MNFKFKTLQMNLFISYSAFFIAVLLIIALLFYSFFSNYSTSNVSEQQRQLCTSVSNSLDAEIKKMDTVSMNIIYSNLIKDRFQKYLSLKAASTTGNDLIYLDRYSNTTSLIDLLMSILGPFQTVSQANIYDLNGNMVGAGLFNGEVSVNLNIKSWYDKTFRLGGSRYVSVPSQISMLDAANIFLKNHSFISTCRVYSDSNFEKQGIVEVIQDCETIFKYVNDIKSSDANLQIYVVNSDGDYIYPYGDKTVSAGTYYKHLVQKNSMAPLKIYNVNNPSDSSKEEMTYTISEYSGWSVIVVQSEKVIFSSLKNFTRNFILLSIIALLIILLLSYVVSGRVTVPLRKLRHALKNMNIDELSAPGFTEPKMDKHEINEIERLNNTFNAMYQKLGKSLNELLISKEEELNAKLLAVQSQMNPHFLYNNLANISVMAEENMNAEIVSMCSDLSYMLRYISTESKNGVTLRAELDYAEKYINCMKIRYEDKLQCHINVPEEMMSLTVPKLIIQPLVENSIKYGLNSSPPWHITINGRIDNDKWYITVSDSGPGFDPSIIDKIKEFMKSTNDLSQLPELQIGGMGLLNICIRLKIMYKENATFEIQNLLGGGTMVSLSGSIKY